ncbi:MAG: hypothetical protein R6X25_04775 [Candidatus Krumholzibacteriia bacterium]
MNPALLDGLEVWVAALLTLMVFSFLWRDNPLYKLAEHIFVGVSAAYWMVVGFWTTLWPNAVVELFPEAARVTHPDAEVGARDLGALIPVVLGLLMLTRLVPRFSWLGRWPTAFAVGTTAGFAIVRYLRSDLLNQVHATLAPGLIVREAGGVMWFATVNQVLILVGVVSGLAYFTYTRAERGGLSKLGRVGLVVLMITFGTSFGYAVMGRVTLLVGRLQFLMQDWLGAI